MLAMETRTCRRCRKTGFIRTERVIKGITALTVFYCGACGYSWEERDRDPAT